MEPILRRVPRRPPWPAWAITTAAAWLGLALLARLFAPWMLVCPWRRLTGIPCPGCGLTRGVTAIAHGEIARGLAFNPLLLTALLVLLTLAVLRLVFGREPRLRPTRAWLLPALLLVAANWAYVLRTDHAAAPLEQEHVAPHVTKLADPLPPADAPEPASGEER